MTEWDFRPPVHNGPTAPKRLGRTTQGMERVKRKAMSKYVKITRSERRRKKKKGAGEEGSGSPLGQAVLPVELACFLLPGRISLWRDLMPVNNTKGMKEGFNLELSDVQHTSQLKGNWCVTPPCSGDGV